MGHSVHVEISKLLTHTVGRTARFSKTMLEAVSDREKYIQLSGNISGGHSCSQSANYTLLKNLTAVALCCVTKLHILEWPLIVPSTRCICVMIMLFNQLLDMPEKCSLTGMCNGVRLSKESRTDMQRGGYTKTTKRNVKTYTACLVNTNTETGTITHEIQSETPAT
jgi:hypothetical protein